MLLTQDDFGLSLAQLVDLEPLLTAVQIEVTTPVDFPNLMLGEAGEGEPRTSIPSQLAGRLNVTAQTKLWLEQVPELQTQQRIQRSVEKLLNDYWRGDLRDEKTTLVSHELPGTKNEIQATLEAWDDGRATCLAFADLDNFGAFNNSYNQDMGDKVILLVAAALQQRLPTDSLVFHLSGDEYVLLVSGSDASDALMKCHEARIAANVAIQKIVDGLAPPKRGEKPTSTLKMGVAVRQDRNDLYEELKAAAEASTKDGNGDKRRDQLSIAGAGDATEVVVENPVECALASTMCQLDGEEPFGIHWLNMISRSVAELVNTTDNAESLALTLRDYLAAAFPLDVVAFDESRLNAMLRFSDQVACSGGTSLSDYETLLAVVHGFSRAVALAEADFGEIEIELGQDRVSLLAADNVLFSAQVHGAVPRRIRLDVRADGRSYNAARAVLIRVGYGELQLPVGVFAAVVRVDDRPTIGGGLPDFWGPAVAEVIETALKHPNVSQVIFSGIAEHGRRTLQVMQDASHWPDSVDDLARKTGLEPSQVLAAAERLTGAVTIAQTVDEMVDCLITQLEQNPRIDADNDVERVEAERGLERQIDPNVYSLALDNGIRASTPASAFPVALEVIRKSGVPPICDQEARTMLELPHFQILVDDFSRDLVPFHHRDETGELEAYFEREFRDPTGVYGSLWAADGSSYESFVKTIQDSIDGEYTTRRALLTIDNNHAADGDYKPLGLVSIRARPVHTEDAITLDFAVSWRTVEALVGLPFSMYASARLGMSVLDGLQSGGRVLQAGKLYYVAQSLHLFVDGPDRRIAGRIVDAVSR